MNQRRLGRTGLKVSEICLGTMTFAGQCDEVVSRRILDTAADRGVTFIDTADAYPIPPEIETAGRTEELLGHWLRGRRDAFVLASKCRLPMGPGANDRGLSRRHILSAIEGSLRRLGTDYLDLYQLHMPDPETPLEETIRALDDLVRSGKVRYIGVSNFPSWQVALGLGISGAESLSRFDCVQPRYNLLYREAETELLPLCRDQGLGVIAYNPLAGGFLSGKYLPSFDETAEAPEGTRFALGASGDLYRDRYWKEAQSLAVARLKDYFDRREIPMATLAVAWVLAQPGISAAIVGASRPEQLDTTLNAAQTTLDGGALAVIDEAWWTLPRRPASP